MKEFFDEILQYVSGTVLSLVFYAIIVRLYMIALYISDVNKLPFGVLMVIALFTSTSGFWISTKISKKDKE